MKAKRRPPKSLVDGPERVWDALWYLRRIVTTRARYFWAIHIKIPKRLGLIGAADLEDWWLKHHYLISGRQRRNRRKDGGGNAFLIRCGRIAVLWTNGTKDYARTLMDRTRREVFWEPHDSLPHMALHHVADGVPFRDLKVRYRKRKNESGDGRRLYVLPKEDTMEAFRQKIWTICRWREGRRRWARKPRTIVRQYNEFLADWWKRFQYCDWETGQIKHWDKWARHRLLRKVSQEVKRRNAYFIKRAKEKGNPTEGLSPAKIVSPRGFSKWLYALIVRLGPRRIWRLGDELASVEIPPYEPKDTTQNKEFAE